MRAISLLAGTSCSALLTPLAAGDRVRVIEAVRCKGQNTFGWEGVVTDACERDELEWGCCQQASPLPW